MSQRKKKLTSSFYTDEESINYSVSRRQPKKTVVIDEKRFIFLMFFINDFNLFI